MKVTRLLGGKLKDRAQFEAKQLIEEIEIAFADVPRPRVTRSVARAFDDEWHLSEARQRELSIQDSEVQWSDVKDEDIQNCQEYFSFSDAEGWRFYLPAYMRHYLRRLPECSWHAVYWACISRENVGLLSEHQLSCIGKFIELCHRYEVRPRIE